MYFLEASEYVLTAAVFILANVFIVTVILSIYLKVLKRRMINANRARQNLEFEFRRREVAFAFHQLYQIRPTYLIKYPRSARDLFLEEDILCTVFLEKKWYGGEGFGHHVFFGTCDRCGIPLPSWRQCRKCYRRLCYSTNPNSLVETFRCDDQEHVADLLDDRPQCRRCKRSCASERDAVAVA